MYYPWDEDKFVQQYAAIESRTLVSRDRCYVLHVVLTSALSTPGSVAEMGVYRGGTARLLADTIDSVSIGRPLFLFDTFSGMPAADPARDLHKEGDFADASLHEVNDWMGNYPNARFIEGRIPESLAGLEKLEICFAHLDLDLYRSVLDAVGYIWPRLAVGGSIVFDDYGFDSCPGAKDAVNEFFVGKASCPLVLHTGQAIVHKSRADA